MRYLKLYEKFKSEQDLDLDVEEIELSDKTIDDIFKKGFFDDESESDDNKVITIKNWKQY